MMQALKISLNGRGAVNKFQGKRNADAVDEAAGVLHAMQHHFRPLDLIAIKVIAGGSFFRGPVLGKEIVIASGKSQPAITLENLSQAQTQLGDYILLQCQQPGSCGGELHPHYFNVKT